MKTPRLFLSAAVLFWGWQVHLLWIAICLGLLLESASLIKSKFDFKPSDFNKFIDISTIEVSHKNIMPLIGTKRLQWNYQSVCLLAGKVMQNYYPKHLLSTSF